MDTSDKTLQVFSRSSVVTSMEFRIINHGKNVGQVCLVAPIIRDKYCIEEGGLALTLQPQIYIISSV